MVKMSQGVVVVWLVAVTGKVRVQGSLFFCPRTMHERPACNVEISFSRTFCLVNLEGLWLGVAHWQQAAQRIASHRPKGKPSLASHGYGNSRATPDRNKPWPT
jgi:hypothetical protein